MFRSCFVPCSAFILLTTFAFPQGKGMEFRYEGMVENRFSFAKEQPLNYSERVTLTVVVVGDLGGTRNEAIQIRLTETLQERPVRTADVQIGEISADGKFLPTSRFGNLPMLFVSPKQIGVGKARRAEEVLDERFFGQVLKGRVSYFAVGKGYQDWRRVEEAKRLEGKPAPDFELPTADGKGKIKLSDLRGKIVLLNFFAHW
jgi:hypothetical protein